MHWPSFFMIKTGTKEKILNMKKTSAGLITTSWLWKPLKNIEIKSLVPH